MGTGEGCVGVVVDVFWGGEGVWGVVDEVGHEGEEYVAHFVEEVL